MTNSQQYYIYENVLMITVPIGNTSFIIFNFIIFNSLMSFVDPKFSISNGNNIGIKYYHS